MKEKIHRDVRARRKKLGNASTGKIAIGDDSSRGLKSRSRQGTSGKDTKAKKLTKCRSCKSLHIADFLGEICLHFNQGVESLNKPLIWLFPKIPVCLDCGFAQFKVSAAELLECRAHS